MATNVTRHSMRVLSSRARSSLRPTSNPYSQRKFSSSPSCAEQEQVEKPRWAYTPPGAKAPVSLNAIESKRPHFPVNEDQAVLDKFYISLLGKEGDKVLSENIKWLAVTHKSFDQGRRGFNDRLALLGMPPCLVIKNEMMRIFFLSLFFMAFSFLCILLMQTTIEQAKG
jgi:large subunit ribosomal protein L15